MQWLKQSTAATVKLGPFVDSTDGVTAETALTISQADIRLSKNGGDIAQSNNAAGATHDELGYYDVPLDTTDTNTLGRLDVIVSESGALPVFRSFMVLEAAKWDALFGTAPIPANTTQIEGSDASDVINAQCDQALTDYDAVVPADLPSNFGLLGINGSGHVSRVTLVDTTTTNTDMRGTDGANTTAPDNASIAAILVDTGTTLPDTLGTLATASALTTVDTVVDAIKLKTDLIADAGVSGTVSGSGSASSFAGDAGLSTTDDFYNGSVLVFTSGTLKGLARRVTDYTGSTRTFAFAVAFPSAPDNADAFLIIGRIDA